MSSRGGTHRDKETDQVYIVTGNRPAVYGDVSSFIQLSQYVHLWAITTHQLHRNGCAFCKMKAFQWKVASAIHHQLPVGSYYSNAMELGSDRGGIALLIVVVCARQISAAQGTPCFRVDLVSRRRPVCCCSPAAGHSNLCHGILSHQQTTVHTSNPHATPDPARPSTRVETRPL